jgi:hypothetical protein
MANEILTQDQVKSLFHYDADNGILKWRVNNGVNVLAGDIAGCKNHHGYTVIRFKKKSYQAHRLAWLYVYGNVPTQQIDHINRDRSDNRLINLRLATPSLNNQNKQIQRNNTSGCKGVSYHKKNKKWVSHIGINNKKNRIGQYENISDAIQARRIAEIILRW